MLARAWVRYEPETGRHTATIKNHPADWRRDLTLDFENEEEALDFAKQGLRDIVGNIESGPASPAGN